MRPKLNLKDKGQISKPNEDHDGGNDEKQEEAGQKASKDMNLEKIYSSFVVVKHFR